MANTGGTQGGSHEQHGKAGAQSHKKTTTLRGKRRAAAPTAKRPASAAVLNRQVRNNKGRQNIRGRKLLIRARDGSDAVPRTLRKEPLFKKAAQKLSVEPVAAKPARPKFKKGVSLLSVQKRSRPFLTYSFGTLRANSASHAAALPSEGARQSPRGESAPPATTLGPFGMAERLNWLKAKKRRRKSSSHFRISPRLYCVAPRRRKMRRPGAGCRVAPGMHGQEGDFRRPETVAQRIEQIEILQRVRADFRFRALRRGAGLDGTSSGEISVAKIASSVSAPTARRTRRTAPPSGSDAGSAFSARRH